jgi:putative colanic acid biosynthesis acetyltransferase WcaF
VELQKLESTSRFPYPAWEYVVRLLWAVCQATVWKLGWSRLPFLRSNLLRLFGAKLDGNSLFRGSVSILRPHGCKIGKRVAIGSRVHIYNLSTIEIGDDSVVSQDVYLCGGTHGYTLDDLPLERSPISIGRGVWICAGAFIGPGVVVGDGAVIGARAVVMKDVEPNAVMAGNPAQKVKDRVVRPSVGADA